MCSLEYIDFDGGAAPWRRQPFRYDVTDSSVYGFDLIFMQMMMNLWPSPWQTARVGIPCTVHTQPFPLSSVYFQSGNFHIRRLVAAVCRCVGVNELTRNKPIKSQLVGSGHPKPSTVHGTLRYGSENSIWCTSRESIATGESLECVQNALMAKWVGRRQILD